MAQLVEYRITVPKEGGSSPPRVFGAAAAESPNSIWRKFTAVVENVASDRAPRGVARHGMAAQYGTQPSPCLYFLAGVTRRAYFYGLYNFAFLECALPGVNQRPQFGQCRFLKSGLIQSVQYKSCSIHCKKGLAVFASPARIKLFPLRKSLVSNILVGNGKMANLFFTVYGL